MRLDKFLVDMGVGTRSEVKKDIKAGYVKVGGSIVNDPGYHIKDTDEVTYRGENIAYESFEYYMLNKPAGVISATEDKKQTTVIELLNERKRKDLFPVGRLDKDTEGLLLITNDGELAHRLLSPKKHVDKVYYAKLQGRVDEEDVRKFREGLVIDEEFTALPAELVILKSGDISEIKVTIREGKFHQIKRMFKAVDKEVIYLKRLSMGTLQLDSSLKEGEYRKLTDEELKELMDISNLERKDS
ncbi:MAG: pseudouridine synthase [Anaerovoracaceae bacterium]